MYTFLIIWLSQLVSKIGSRMTWFAITIWMWDLTGHATALTLVHFFGLLPSIVMAPIAGIMVDRFNRKHLMVIGDTAAAVTTLAIFLLFWSDRLQIWHLYLISAIEGAFFQLQRLAYSASVALLVPKQHYARASSLEFIWGYGSAIVAPALAGFLYYIIGFPGITLIDSLTFLIAISTLLAVSIPQPPQLKETSFTLSSHLWQELQFGFRHIRSRPALLALLAVTILFNFPVDLSDALYSPMILARTDNNAVVLGSLASAAGIGGVTGALLISTWGGFNQRMRSISLGMVGAGLSKFVFGLSRTPMFWIPSQVCSSFNFPIIGSAEQAIWLSKISPDVQGRVFAATQMTRHLTLAIAYLLAGPLADSVFEPAMSSSGLLAPGFSRFFGTGAGAGMALLFVLCAIWMVLTGLCGYAFPLSRQVETLIPDHDVVEQ